jgi:hypothetical protein
MTNFWISCSWATGFVQVDDEGIIIDTAPVWKRFKGQCIESLTSWLKKKSEVKIVNITEKQRRNINLQSKKGKGCIKKLIP